MSFYSGGEVKTRIIDPVNDITNRRSEFRLDDLPAVMTNMKLLNVGVKSNSGTPSYGRISGAYGIIKNIKLMDGNTELSSCRGANTLLGFKNALMTNSMNESVHSVLSKSSQGYFVASDDGKSGEERETENGITNDANTTNTAHLDLRLILPLLSELRSIDSLRFNKLRLVVEYETRPKHISSDGSKSYETIRPSLCVDVIEDEGVRNSELNNTPSSVSWVELEKDELHIDAVAVSGSVNKLEQKNNLKVNAFNNKTLGRLLLVKKDNNVDNTFSGNDVVGNGNDGSKGLYLQQTQYRVNGRNILAGQGIEGNNQRMAHLVDTWGEINQTTGGNVLGCDVADFCEVPAGDLDYEGIMVGEPIKDLQISLNRTGVYNGGTQKQNINALSVDVYGEVNKVIQFKGDEYMISYN